MNATNLVLLSVSLATNHQSAVTARTNNLAQVSHVEQVQRLEVTAWRVGRRILSRQTNVVNLPPRRWNEVVPDLTPAPATAQPATAPVVTQTVPAVQPKVVVASPPPRPGPNTNSPAFRRRAEMEARRAAAQATRTNTAPPVAPAPATPVAPARTNQPALKP